MYKRQVIICIIISCLSPFIASGNPDGLEKSAEDAGLAEDYGVCLLYTSIRLQILEESAKQTRHLVILKKIF